MRCDSWTQIPFFECTYTNRSINRRIGHESRFSLSKQEQSLKAAEAMQVAVIRSLRDDDGSLKSHYYWAGIAIDGCASVKLSNEILNQIRSYMEER